jgi:hypothetical protein
MFNYILNNRTKENQYESKCLLYIVFFTLNFDRVIRNFLLYLLIMVKKVYYGVCL